MADKSESKVEVATIKLGSQGLKVGKIGFGCMGMSFDPPMTEQEGVALLQAVHAKGVTLFDTSEAYRTNPMSAITPDTKWNEEYLGKFVQTVPRDSVTIATKYMPMLHKSYDLATVEQALDVSLTKLGVSFVDLYYLHRMPPTIEDLKIWMASVAELVKKGKVKYVGLSEVSPEWLRAAHGVFSVSVIQQEWSLLTRSPIEDYLVPVCKELGVGIVAYSPLARNLLTESPGGAMRIGLQNLFPRFKPENLKKNAELTAQIAELGKSKNASPSELSLAWLYQRAQELGVDVCPIPGTTKLANAASNIRSLQVSLSEADMQKLGELGSLVAGDRAAEGYTAGGVEGQLAKASQEQKAGMPSLALGSQGLRVSKIGFGCMGLTVYGGVKEDDAVTLLQTVHAQGVNHFDTAEIYFFPPFEAVGPNTKFNESLVGRFAKTVPRDSFTVATKFWPSSHNAYDLTTVERTLDASLARLSLGFVDVYYLHRMPETLDELKEWMRSVAALVKKGKIKYVGLSEVSPEWLKVAHTIFPVSVIQQEWSLLTRSPIEDHLVPVCKELGIGIVAYSPLARNLLTEQPREPAEGIQAIFPRFSPENLKKNQELAAKIVELGRTKGVSASELSLAWLYHRAKELGVVMCAIPGTTKTSNALSNIRSLQVTLSDSDAAVMAELGTLVAGDRGSEGYIGAAVEGQLAKSG